MPAGGRETPLTVPPTWAGQGLFSWTAGQASGEWFGPGATIPAVAQEQAFGRGWDFPVAYNLQTRPKVNEGPTFSELRGLADGYDLMRLAIETRKDQMDPLDWAIKGRDKKDGGSKARKIEEFLWMPDQEHTWHQWLRALLEDLLVLDAPCIFPRRTKGGELWGLELMDGATIKRVLDEGGRTPLEGVAYQQIIKGLPASEYSRKELIYAPRNIRTSRVYGYGPVEQVITTVNIALRRQLSQLSYYTEGSTPDMLFGVPKEWNPDQIRAFQSWFNNLLSGNQVERARARFIPGDIKPVDTKERALVDKYDEWLARIICYAFSLSPQSLVQQMNRATAETAQETAVLEGLKPLQNWLKGLMDRILREQFEAPELEFAWVAEEELDPEAKSRIHCNYVREGILEINEVREELGKDPLPEPEPPPELAPMPPTNGQPEGAPAQQPNATAPEAGQGGTKVEPEPEPAKKAETCSCGHHGQEWASLKASRASLAKAKGRRGIKPITRDRKVAKAAEKKLAAQVKKLFRAQATALAVQIEDAIAARFGKAEGAFSSEDLDWIVGQLNLEGWASLTPKAKRLLQQIAEDGGARALEQIGVKAELAANAAMVNQVNEDAVAWAENRSAAMVTSISETTRERLRNDVAGAIDLGLSTDDLADMLSASYSFSDERAEMIARTEIRAADVEGNLAGYRASGVVESLEWIVSSEGGCPICEANLGAVIQLGGTFPSGDPAPPAHPNCICDVLPVLNEAPESEKVAKLLGSAVEQALVAAAAQVAPVADQVEQLQKAMQPKPQGARSVQIQRDEAGRVVGAVIEEDSHGA